MIIITGFGDVTSVLANLECITSEDVVAIRYVTMVFFILDFESVIGVLIINSERDRWVSAGTRCPMG